MEVLVPHLGESVTEAFIGRWLKKDGDAIQANEPILELETDKANVEVRADRGGTLRIVKREGAVKPGEVVARIEEAGAEAAPPAEGATPKTQAPAKAKTAARAGDGDGGAAAPAHPKPPRSPAHAPAPAPAPAPEPALGPSARRRLAQNAGVEEEARTERPRARAPGPAPAPRTEPAAEPEPEPEPEAAPAAQAQATREEEPADGGERRTPMSRLRKRIAERLVQAQRQAAILTTFNEVDMSAVMELRARQKARFQEVHGVSLGYMSFFARACALALRDVPAVNAEIRGDDIVWHEAVHLGIAVSTERGLVVPVVRNAERRSFADLEREVARLAALARDARLAPDDLVGGTFTITNGGIFGSLLSTPILSPPESGILGMHKIEDRPVAVNKEVKVRPMMYLALSYDHRLIDGREAVTFLVKVKERIEDPGRLLLEV